MIIVGKIMMPSITEARYYALASAADQVLHKRYNNNKSKKTVNYGWNTSSNSAAGFNTVYNFFGQKRARKIAQRSPAGTPRIIAPAVTMILAIIIEKSRKCPDLAPM